MNAKQAKAAQTETNRNRVKTKVKGKKNQFNSNLKSQRPWNPIATMHYGKQEMSTGRTVL